MERDERRLEWLQVGNFLLQMEKNVMGMFVVAKSVSREWSVRWGEGSGMFFPMMRLAVKARESEGVKEYLHSLLTMMYVATSYPHDLTRLAEKKVMPFCEGVAKLLKEEMDYDNAEGVVATESQQTGPDGGEVAMTSRQTGLTDDEALEEVVAMREIEEELERLDAEKDEGGR